MENRKKIKVCHLTSVHPAFDPRIFYKEIKTLFNAGYDVTLIAQHDKNEIVDGVKIISLPKSKNRFGRIFFLSKKAYKLALKQKADIYHFHDPELIPWMLKLKRKTKAKIIYDVHEDYSKDILSKYWIPKIFRSLFAKFFDFYEKRKIKKIDFIITVNENIGEKFKKINPKAEIIKNSPLIEEFDVNKIQKKNKSIIHLIYVGELVKTKGITQIIKAMEYLPENIKLILLGNFSPENYKNEIKKLKGFKKIEYCGQVPFKEVFQYLLHADIGLVCFLPLLNYIDSNPNKLFEYMAAGIPVVASNFPLWKEIVEGNKCGICVDPLNPKEIAKAIEYLIEHPEDARQMGENGKKAVSEKYNWGAESKKLLDIYKRLCAE